MLVGGDLSEKTASVFFFVNCVQSHFFCNL